jgi:hypothetical protein
MCSILCVGIMHHSSQGAPDDNELDELDHLLQEVPFVCWCVYTHTHARTRARAHTHTHTPTYI